MKLEQADVGKESAAPSERGGVFRLGLIVAGALIVYVLGIGPAVRIHHSYPATRPCIEAVYRPLQILDQNSPPLHNSLEFYIRRIWKAK